VTDVGHSLLSIELAAGQRSSGRQDLSDCCIAVRADQISRSRVTRESYCDHLKIQDTLARFSSMPRPVLARFGESELGEQLGLTVPLPCYGAIARAGRQGLRLSKRSGHIDFVAIQRRRKDMRSPERPIAHLRAAGRDERSRLYTEVYLELFTPRDRRSVAATPCCPSRCPGAPERCWASMSRNGAVSCTIQERIAAVLKSILITSEPGDGKPCILHPPFALAGAPRLRSGAFRPVQRSAQSV
jgi:hypothetical protein